MWIMVMITGREILMLMIGTVRLMAVRQPMQIVAPDAQLSLKIQNKREQ